MRRPRNGFCPQAAHRPPTLPPRVLASAARAVFISITTAEEYGLGGARQPCFQESARRKSFGTGLVARRWPWARLCHCARTPSTDPGPDALDQLLTLRYATRPRCLPDHAKSTAEG